MIRVSPSPRSALCAESPSPAGGEGRTSPLPLREREGPAAQPWEGEGETPRLPTHAELLERARWMRRNPTDAEQRLWTMLRDKRAAPFKFKRQQIIFPYIADFVCFERRLIIEADGSHHADNKYDERRDAFLRSQGFEILRFWNNQVLGESAAVAEAIYAALTSPHPPKPAAWAPPSPRGGEGLEGASLG